MAQMREIRYISGGWSLFIDGVKTGAPLTDTDIRWDEANKVILDSNVPANIRVNARASTDTYIIRQTLAHSITIADTLVTAGEFNLIKFDDGVVATALTKTATNVVITLAGGATITVSALEVTRFQVGGGAVQTDTQFVAAHAAGFTALINDAPQLIRSTLAANPSATVVLSQTNLLVTDADIADGAADLTYTLTDATASTGVLEKSDGSNWVLLVNNNTFTQADVNEGNIRFVANAGAMAGGGAGDTSFAFTVADGGEDGVQPVGFTLETSIRAVHVVANMAEANPVDASMLVAAQIINTGDANDVIKAGKGNDQINAGLGNDKIDLSAGGADEVIYAFGAHGVAFDGGDTITAFKRGEDKLIFRAAEIATTTTTTLDAFLASARGTNLNSLDDDLFIVTPNYELDTGTSVFYITGVTFNFREAGIYSGSKISSGLLSVAFVERITWANFLTDIGGIGEIDLDIFALKDPRKLSDVLGAGSIAFQLALPLNIAPVLMVGGADAGMKQDVSVAENTPIMTAVRTFIATDADSGDTLEYSISGVDAARFAIGLTTGMLTFKAAPNFEIPTDAGGNNIYNLKVIVSDGTISDSDGTISDSDGGGTDSTNIVVRVTNVDEAATIFTLTSPVASLAEDANKDGRAKVADLNVTDVDGGFAYELSGTDVALFEVFENALYIKASAALDFESAKKSLSVTVTIAGTSLTQPLTITITNADEGDGVYGVSGTLQVGQTLTASQITADPDGLEGTLSYQWEAQAVGAKDWLEIASATASTYTLTASELGARVRVVVTYTDKAGIAETVYVLKAGGVQTMANNPASGAIMVSESVPPASVNLHGLVFTAKESLGDLTAQSIRIRIGATEAVNYMSASHQLDIAVVPSAYPKLGLLLAFLNGKMEVASRYDVTIADAALLTENTPSALFNSMGSLVVSTPSAGAPTQGKVLEVDVSALVDDDVFDPMALSYQWLRDGAEIPDAKDATYDLEQADVGALISVRVSFVDAGGSYESVTSAATAAIVNVDDAPIALVIRNSVASVAEDLTARTKVADLDVTDVDGGYAYELKGENAALFEADLSTNALYLKAGAGLDYETTAELSVTVAIVGTSLEEPFTIAVTDTNDAPAVANAIDDHTLNKDTAFNFIVPTNTFVDADAGGDADGALTYFASLADADESPLPDWLEFNTATRTFTGTPENADIGEITVRVRATDMVGAKVTDDFTITVTNMDMGDAAPLGDLGGTIL